MTQDSLHLQNFPDLSFLNDEKELIADMDMVRAVCSVALFIRDSQNLRVRLPLNKLTIIGRNASRMLAYKDIIADEVNIKNINTIEEIGNKAELKLQINFKKVGARLGSKMKKLTIAAKNGDWQNISDGKIAIAQEILENDEFEVKLITKNNQNTAPLPTNDCLIELDINITKELEEEGVARDIIRLIQQNRKDANLNVSDRIIIKCYSNNSNILEAIKSYEKYICEQTLTTSIELCQNSQTAQDCRFSFQNKLEENQLEIGFDIFQNS